jgi:hypothetical protein
MVDIHPCSILTGLLSAYYDLSQLRHYTQAPSYYMYGNKNDVGHDAKCQSCDKHLIDRI